MTTYFAMPLAQPVQQGIDELLKNLDTRVSAPQHDLHTRVSIDLSDDTLRICVEEMMARFQGGESAGILHTLLSILKSTSHMLIRQMLGKGSNDDVNRMAKYLRDRRHVLNGALLFGFPMPAELASRFATTFAAIRAGQGEQHRAELTRIMLTFADMAVERFYDDFVAPMDLGFLKRKGSDLGRATILKGCHVAVNKLFPHLDQKDLEIFADYFDSLLVSA
ncbi:MAG: hypothetical protein K0Q68_1932 [Moraxellaceae bacterium]|jgi:hypothetical protein|nr:hypothetical protein [Moraxellaceae bacterium]